MKILVLSGTSNYKFVSLFEALSSVVLEHDVEFQFGNSEKLAAATRNTRFHPRVELLKLFPKVDAIITSAGIGSILDLLDFSSKTILFPRRLIGTETNNDQSTAAEYFAREYGYMLAFDEKSLQKCLMAIQGGVQQGKASTRSFKTRELLKSILNV